MRFDELSRENRIKHKNTVIADFMEHGMNEKEAVVNYVFCINLDPYPWLEYRHSVSKDEADALRDSGMAKYNDNNGKHEYRNILPASWGKKGKHSCRCRAAIVPK